MEQSEHSPGAHLNPYLILSFRDLEKLRLDVLLTSKAHIVSNHKRKLSFLSATTWLHCNNKDMHPRGGGQRGSLVL